MPTYRARRRELRRRLRRMSSPGSGQAARSRIRIPTRPEPRPSVRPRPGYLAAGFATGKTQIDSIAHGEPTGILHDRSGCIGDDAVAPVENPQRIQMTQAPRAGVGALRRRRYPPGTDALPPLALRGEIPVRAQ